MDTISRDDQFYARGLRFTCVRCSNCCRHDPGFVFLSRHDIERLSAGLSISLAEFLRSYCRAIKLMGIARVSLTEKSNFDCVFWNNDGCSVYEHRPLQCRAYPFWSANLASQETWDALQPSCPGVNQGKKHSRRMINSWLAKRIQEPFADADDPSIARYLKLV